MIQSRRLKPGLFVRAAAALGLRQKWLALMAALVVCQSLPSAWGQVLPLPPMESLSSPWSKLGQQDQPTQPPAPQMPAQPELAQRGQSPKEPAAQYLAQQDHPHSGLVDLFQKSAYTPPPSSAEPCISHECCDQSQWHSQVIPQGIIYQSYMAGTKEPRFATFFNQNSAMGDMWDVTLGARAGIWRYGNDDPNWPEGWQVDFEGAVFPRLDPNGESTPLIGDDYRFGIPVTYGNGNWEFKVGYYHISAHLGDEFIIQNPAEAAARINYVRDGVVFGAGYFWTDSLRLYGEVGVAAVDGGAEPLEFQFGFEWMQARNTGFRGGPFIAVNADLRQEVDYNGTFAVQFGWMWRKYVRGSNLRLGGQYVCGKSDEYEFFRQSESRIGWGLWYDF